MICDCKKSSFIFLLFTFYFLLSTGCGRGTGVSVDLIIGDPEKIGPLNPPYLPQVVFSSGLRLDLETNGELSNTYPTPQSNPFGASHVSYYERVAYFINLNQVSASERLSDNFRLSEFVNPTVQRGGTHAYVDAEIAQHIQLVRSGLGRALVLSSSFRSPEHNRSVGGATFSRHIYGDAVDVDVDQSRSDANARAQEIFNEAQDVGLNFVLPLSETSVTVNGVQRVSWVHMDDRGF
ncbi:MAG: hypothetical protein HOE48_05790 [Candidatus Latescibacteria bacterium]|nr:hypothetical protein [Candidatus Latescibacterota bacterium]